jgi:hypothetical protein
VAAKLFAKHDAAGHTRYQALKQLARTQRRVLPGAPGLLKRRTCGRTEYGVREVQLYRRAENHEHIGTVEAVTPARLADMRVDRS